MNIFDQLFNRKIVNDPKLQYGIVGFFVGLATINLIFVLILLGIFKNKLIEDISALDGQSQLYMTSIIETWSPVILSSILLFGGFTIIFSFVCGLYILQRIAGPLYVVKKYLQQTLEGRTERKPIMLRKHDFLKDLADLINEIDKKYIHSHIEKNKSVTDSQPNKKSHL